MRMYPKLTAARLKQYAQLTRKKNRKQDQLFLIEGVRAVRQALNHADLEIVAVITQEKSEIESDALGLSDSSTEIFSVSAPDFRKISDTENNQGVAAVAKIPSPLKPDSLNPKTHPLLLALDGIRDPGNLGTIYRTAAWYGVNALLLDHESVDLFNPKVVRSTVGATGAVPYLYCSLDEQLAFLSTAGWKIYVLDLDENAIFPEEIKPDEPMVLVTGNEAHGIRTQFSELYQPVYLPGNPKRVESLNAAVATGILLSSVRQRHNFIPHKQI